MLVVARERDAGTRSGKIRLLNGRALNWRRQRLAVAMVLVVCAIAGLAYEDAARESTAALQDFAEEQATLARALGAALRLRATGTSQMTEAELLAGLRAVERPNALVILVGRPGDRALQATDGRRVVSDRLAAALGRQDAVVRIPRNESAPFGLPPRTALAGLARVDGVAGGPWQIVAVASAERERDREVWARRRLVLSVLTAAGLVLVFGGLAMRKQRKELVLERELAIADLRQSRDERLERASKAAAMGTLAMGVAHEISTPLGVIAARAEQMRPRVVADERLSAGVNAILSQTDRINQVIRGSARARARRGARERAHRPARRDRERGRAGRAPLRQGRRRAAPGDRRRPARGGRATRGCSSTRS